MKSNFKRFGLAAAVSAVAAGYAGMADAQTSVSRAIGNLGDTAIIPYYTVQDNWVTGVHIINTSEATQVVKLRLRRASDSADALDFNLVLSPKDEWTGFIDDSSGRVAFTTTDSSCTVPVRSDGVFTMPTIYEDGAEEGYIEVIGMGQPTSEAEPIAIFAKHTSAGVPGDCNAVASNFFANLRLNSTGTGTVDYRYWKREYQQRADPSNRDPAPGYGRPDRCPDCGHYRDLRDCGRPGDHTGSGRWRIGLRCVSKRFLASW